MSGKFITIEGSEGAGKTTVLNAVMDFLVEKGRKVVVTREPGGTEIGEKIRTILLDKDIETMHSDTELLLMFAARAQHWQEKILPSLENDIWVLSDRFIDSSFAYQGGGREMDLSRIATLEQWVLGDAKPDITILMDLDPEIGMARARQRSLLDRFEQEQTDFFQRVREVFLARAKAEPQRFAVIDAAQSEAAVKASVIKRLSNYV